MLVKPPSTERSTASATAAPFSIQSISKAFALALVVARDAGGLWSRVGREPSGDAFNSLVALEHDRGVPRDPFIEPARSSSPTTC
jgi:glutaminase